MLWFNLFSACLGFGLFLCVEHHRRAESFADYVLVVFMWACVTVAIFLHIGMVMFHVLGAVNGATS